MGVRLNMAKSGMPAVTSCPDGSFGCGFARQNQAGEPMAMAPRRHLRGFLPGLNERPIAAWARCVGFCSRCLFWVCLLVSAGPPLVLEKRTNGNRPLSAEAKAQSRDQRRVQEPQRNKSLCQRRIATQSMLFKRQKNTPKRNASLCLFKDPKRQKKTVALPFLGNSIEILAV